MSDDLGQQYAHNMGHFICTYLPYVNNNVCIYLVDFFNGFSPKNALFLDFTTKLCLK